MPGFVRQSAVLVSDERAGIVLGERDEGDIMKEGGVDLARASGATRGALKIAAADVVVALALIALPQRADAQENLAVDSEG